jgi:hypothetical protein
MSGRKDGLFFIDLAASHCLLILWLSAAPPASYANVGGCGIQNGNASSNHTSSATQSILQRNSAALSTEIRESCPFFAILPRQTGLQRTDCSAAKGTLFPLFSGGQVRSPVSGRVLGECNAIRKRGLVHSELTFVGIMQTGFDTSRKPFSGQPVNGRDSLETRAFIVPNLPEAELLSARQPWSTSGFHLRS